MALKSLVCGAAVSVAVFRLVAFGGLSLERDGAPYVGPGSQRRRLAILAVLAAAGEKGVSRERLMRLIWPDSDPARARHSLDEALSGLRREFRSETMVSGVATLHVNQDVLSSDLAAHAAAIAARDFELAASLYTGPFLDGFSIAGVVEFDQWVDMERTTRRRSHARVLEALAADATSRGDAGAAVRWWQSRVALDPLDTPATLSLLLAHRAAGNPSESIRLARVHEALVRQELDTSPGPEWAAAVDALRGALDDPPPGLPATVPAVAMHTDTPGDKPPVTPDASDGALASAFESMLPATAAGSAARPDPPPRQDAHPAARPSLRDDVDPAIAAAAGVIPATPAVGRRWAILIASGVLATVAAFAATRFSRSPDVVVPAGSARASPGRPIAERTSIAVLPFVNTGGNTGDEPFSDGLTDELISALSRVTGVRVTGRTSAFALKGRGLTVRSIADTLDVATVLEGSVRRDGKRLKVSAQLIDASDNGVLWSESYDRELRDVFAVQEEIARAIVRALAPTLSGSDALPRAIEPRDLATYELYLQGRYFLARRSLPDLRRAADHFQQALDRDPKFAQAFAGLAEARVLLVLLANSPPDEELPRARAAVASALQLDSTLAEAHAALGNLREAFDWDADGADRSLTRAVALDPGYATAHLYRGILLLNRGRFDDAVAELSVARTLDPLSAPVRMQLGRAYLFARQPAQAATFLRNAIELNPQFAAAHVQLGDALLQQGKAEEALTSVRRAALLSGGRDSASLAYTLAATGQRTMALDMLTKLLSTADQRYLAPVPIAKAYTALDSTTAAFRWLTRGADERAAQIRTINVMPAFDPLRTDPRWQSLLTRLRLTR